MVRDGWGKVWDMLGWLMIQDDSWFRFVEIVLDRWGWFGIGGDDSG